MTSCTYEEFDAQLHVPAASQSFKEGITIYYTRIKAYLEGAEEIEPQRLTQIPELLQQRIIHLREVTRNRVGHFIIPKSRRRINVLHL